MRELKAILKDVSKGNLEVNLAEKKIEELFASNLGAPAAKSTQKDVKQRTMNETLDGLSGQITLHKIIEKSKRVVQGAELKSSHPGLNAQLSLLANLEISEDCNVANNSVSGSQWSQVRFNQECDARENKFTVTQLSDFICSRSDFCKNQFGLVRLAGVTVCESRFESNRISRTQCSDLSLTESDFTSNRILSCNVRGMAVNGSRLSGLTLLSCQLNECEFDQSDIQGLRFEDCQFEECSFVNCEVVTNNYPVIRNVKAHGLRLQGLHSAEELIAALESAAGAGHNAARSSGGSRERRKK